MTKLSEGQRRSVILAQDGRRGGEYWGEGGGRQAKTQNLLGKTQMSTPQGWWTYAAQVTKRRGETGFDDRGRQGDGDRGRQGRREISVAKKKQKFGVFFGVPGALRGGVQTTW